MDERYPGFGGTDHGYYGPHDQDHLRSSPRAGRTQGYSSARDYAAAGELPGYRGGDYRDSGYRGRDYPRAGRDRDDWNQPRYPQPRARDEYGCGYDRGSDEDRGFFARAGDEVRSWFGDEEAERRRERDQRLDQGHAGRDPYRGDSDYHSWRSQRVAELDRDYDEYRRENQQRFHNEFNSWRTERQGQRDGLSRVAEHMEVVGSDGEHVGKVDKVRGDRIVLAKNDADAGGHHHSIPSRWIQSVDDKVTIRKTAEQAKAAWKDEDRGAFFGGEDRQRSDWSTDHNLNRAFPGTY